MLGIFTRRQVTDNLPTLTQYTIHNAYLNVGRIFLYGGRTCSQGLCIVASCDVTGSQVCQVHCPLLTGIGRRGSCKKNRQPKQHSSTFWLLSFGKSICYHILTKHHTCTLTIVSSTTILRCASAALSEHGHILQ
jgi:hypothetical protein